MARAWSGAPSKLRSSGETYANHVDLSERRFTFSHALTYLYRSGLGELLVQVSEIRLPAWQTDVRTGSSRAWPTSESFGAPTVFELAVDG